MMYNKKILKYVTLYEPFLQVSFSVQTIKDRELFYSKNWIIYNLLIFQNSSLEMIKLLSQAANQLMMISVQEYIHATGRFL